jgi:glycine cleavage system aminomethyltransferase T
VSRGYIESHDFQIEVAGKRYPLDVQLAPFYDPSSARMKR